MKSMREKCLAIVASVLFCCGMVIALPGCGNDGDAVDTAGDNGAAVNDTAAPEDGY